MAQAARDNNLVPTLIGVSSVDGITPTLIYVNPTTNRMLVSAGSATPGGSDTHVQFNDASTLAGDAGFTYNKTTDTARLAGNLECEDILLEDSDNSHYLTITTTSNLTAARTLTLVPGDAARTLTFAGNLNIAADFITSGANSLTLTTTGVTNVTLPTTGTLTTLAGSETLTNKTLTAPILNSVPTLSLDDSDSAFDLTIVSTSTLTAGRTLTLDVNDAARTLTIAASATVSQDYSITGNPQFATLELGHATDTTISRTSAGVIAVEGSNVALASNNLSFFSATTSAQLAGVINDETGSGALVFATSPTLTTPRFADLGYIADANGNEILVIDTVAAAIPYIRISNAATGGNPLLIAEGETNVNLQLAGTGTGKVYHSTGSYGDLTTDTDGATITFNMAVSNVHNVVLGGNRTLALSNVSVGQIFTIRLTQDATGSRTVTWFTTIKWAGGSAPTLTTTVNKADTFIFICTSANNYDGYIVGQNV